MSDRKVFVIGVDGGSWYLLDKLIDLGVMPNLKQLINDSYSAHLKSTMPPVTAPAWSSFITGTKPDKHGVYDFARHQKGSYLSLLNNANTLKAKSLWKILSDHGKTVGIINVPMTYPPEEIQGFVIPGFLTPGVSSQKVITYPENLFEELSGEIDDYEVFLNMSPKATIQSIGQQGFLEKCTHILNKRYKTAHVLYQKYQPDFFMVHFQMTDVVQHWFWHCLDEAHPLYDKEQAAALQKDLFAFYQYLDEKIGELVSLPDANSDLIMISDHGFGPLHSNVFLNRWLYENGFLKINLNKDRALKMIRRIIATIDFLNLRNRLLPSGEKRVSLEKTLQHDFLINWEKTKAVATPASIYGNIFLNLIGREPNGTVNPGEESETLKKKLIAQLATFIDPQTKMPVVEKVFPKEEIFPHDRDEAAPDLLVKPTDGYCIFSQLTETELIKECKPWQEITGTHRQDGIMLMKSHRFKKGKFRDGGANITDLAPTILYLLGVPIPKSMDGRVLNDVIKESALQAQAPQYSSDAETETSETETGYSQKEEDLIRQRLKDLGYLE